MNGPALTEFVIAALIVLLIPGPGVIFVVTRSLVDGRRAGLVSVLGLSAGVLLQAAGVAAGLSALLVASAAAFTLVKLAGVAYLVVLGLRALLRRGAPGASAAPELAPASRRLFVDALLVSVSNPKSAVFFLAFLPQFVAPQAGMVTGQFLLLGVIYAALALLTDGAYALFASRLRDVATGRLMRSSLPRTVEGVVYLGLGVGLALAERKP